MRTRHVYRKRKLLMLSLKVTLQFRAGKRAVVEFASFRNRESIENAVYGSVETF